MSADEIKVTVLKMADADATLSEDAKLLILGALESDEMFAEVLRGEASPLLRPDQTPTTDPNEPVGAYLRSITVSGFRGIGPEVRISLRPGPGLVVIAGRNGSGKSTIAEALEMALTGESYRWLNKTAVWTDSWRNLHGGATATIRVEIAEEGAGLTTIGIDWTPEARLEDCVRWVQRAGKKRQPGLDSLGWAGPMELYRPLLSYDELGGVLDGRPSELYDKLFVLLGLERITVGRDRLSAALHRLSAPQKAAKSLAAELKRVLLESDDPRSLAARTLIAKRSPNVAAVQALVTGSDTADRSSVTAMQYLANLSAPEQVSTTLSANRLREAVAGVATYAGATAEAAARLAQFLEDALALHDESGDRLCPVCGVGSLDAEWARRSRAALDADRAELAALRDARRTLELCRDEVRDLVEGLPEIPVVDEPELTTLAAARSARAVWLAAPIDDVALSDHVVGALPALAGAFAALQEEATRLIAQREDLWAPLALRLGEWVTQQKLADEEASKVAEVSQALDWLKRNSADLRNQRLAPLAARARHIWSTLRQESNVGLDAIRLEGEATRRRVELDADVDGVKTGAFGVMSQGELHALALALFLPRATAPESPFRFVVLDDPIQAMDPTKVEGFVTVIQELAEDHQVIVLSHDDRLPAAVRRAAVKAQIYEVSRRSGSVVTLTDAMYPSMRFLDDAYAFAMDDGVPAEAKARVIPGLCRIALETAAYEVFSTRAYTSGRDRATIETQWGAAPKLKQRLALALHLDRDDSIASWLNGSSRRSDAFTICNRGVHSGISGDHVDDVRAVRSAVKDLRAVT